MILCTCATLFEFIQYATVFKFIQCITLFKFIQNATLFKFIQFQNARHIKNMQQIKTLQAITFNHLLCCLSQLGCPQQPLGHLLLVEEQNNMSFRSISSCWKCTQAHSPCFFVQFLTFDYVSCHNRFCFLLLTLLFQLNITLNLSHICTMQISEIKTYTNPKNSTTNFKQFLTILQQFNSN